MMDIAELTEDMFWNYYTEKYCDETQLERLSKSYDRLPDKGCYIPLMKNKAFLYLPGKNDSDTQRKLYFNAWEDITDDVKRIVNFPSIICNDLENVPEKQYKEFGNINDKIKTRKTLNSGLELLACDKNRPSRVLHLDAVELEIVRVVL